MKNPICRPGNLSLTTHWNGADDDQVGDEFCHAHSGYLRQRCEQQDRQSEARYVLAEFADFVHRQDSNVLSAMEEIAATVTPAVAAELLRIRKSDFRRLSDRLCKFGDFLLNGETRLRRSTKSKPQNSHGYKIARCQAEQSSNHTKM